jgi:four helix bundle protein
MIQWLNDSMAFLMNALDKSLDLRQRTKGYAIRIVRLYRSLPPSSDAQVLGRQLLRSGTSVAANYSGGLPRSLEG